MYNLVTRSYDIGDEDTTVAMATHGSVGEFQITQETWQSYVERLQQYFIANDVKDATKQRAILLNTAGGQTYQLIRNLLAPMDTSFDEIV